MHVEQPRYENKLHEEFFRSAAASGLKANKDFNDWSRPQVRFGVTGSGFRTGRPNVANQANREKNSRQISYSKLMLYWAGWVGGGF